jgi:hypothetical protein
MENKEQELSELILHLLLRTHERLTRAVETIERVDDPAPGPDLIEVAAAIYEALTAFEVFILAHCQSARNEG